MLQFLETDLPQSYVVPVAGIEPASLCRARDFLTTLCYHSRSRVVVWTMSSP